MYAVYLKIKTGVEETSNKEIKTKKGGITCILFLAWTVLNGISFSYYKWY